MVGIPRLPRVRTRSSGQDAQVVSRSAQTRTLGTMSPYRSTQLPPFAASLCVAIRVFPFHRAGLLQDSLARSNKNSRRARAPHAGQGSFNIADRTQHPTPSTASLCPAPVPAANFLSEPPPPIRRAARRGSGSCACVCILHLLPPGYSAGHSQLGVLARASVKAESTVV